MRTMDKNDYQRITEKIIKLLVKEKATNSDALRIVDDVYKYIHADSMGDHLLLKPPKQEGGSHEQLC